MSHPTSARNIANRGASDMTENCLNFRPEMKCNPPIDTQTNHKPAKSPRLTLALHTLMAHPACARNIANGGASDMTENCLNFRPELKCNPPIDTQTNHKPD